jgi:hypothetical protein
MIRLTSAALILATSQFAQAPSVPKTWDDVALSDWATPVAGLGVRPGHFSEREYYAVSGDNLRTYPVYHPDREPPGYWEWLKRLKPEPLVDVSKIRTQAEWIRAGKRVWEELDATSFRSSDPELIAKARSREVLAKTALRPDGTVFQLRWVVTPRGVQLSYLECASCHTRFMPDGSHLPGAPENGALADPGGIGGELAERDLLQYLTNDSPVTANYKTFAAPWVKPDIHARIESMTPGEFGALMASSHAIFAGSDSDRRIHGVFPRINGSPYYMTKIPDLIGIRNRKYIDHTATHRHRGPGDFMRYAALVQGSDCMDFGPHRFYTDKQRRIRYRYDDAVLYAMAQYVYSLEPPPNPHPFNEQAARGQRVFQREGCTSCHTPPLYTNNKLTLAAGYTAPKDHPFREDILPLSVGTDAGLALKTRKGTGLYKVPSLRGVWYRGLYLHDGSIASLEDMFDPKRLGDDYVPSGWRGPGVNTRAINGHDFGLNLAADEKKALIAFLRTL